MDNLMWIANNLVWITSNLLWIYSLEGDGVEEKVRERDGRGQEHGARVHQHPRHHEPHHLNVDQKLLYRNVKRFQVGLVFKAQRLCVSLNSRAGSNEEREWPKTRLVEGSSGHTVEYGPSTRNQLASRN